MLLALLLSFLALALAAQSPHPFVSLPDDYDTNVPPMADGSAPTLVTVDFRLGAIQKVDDPNQRISLEMILWLRWEEPRLVVL